MALISDPSVVASQPVLAFGEFHLHPDGTLFRGDTQIHLAPKELAALRILVRHAGKLVTAAQLQQELWGDIHVSPDSVPRCISTLRLRLGSDGSIQTVYKQGYRLFARVRQDPEAADATIPRLVIMPFAAGPGVPDHLGSAVAEETTAQLTLRRPRIFFMLARDSVFTLASRGLSAQQVGEALKARFVLTGTIQALASHLRLRAEMVQVEDGTQIWVEDVLIRRERIADLPAYLVERLVFRSGSALAGTVPPFEAAEAVDPTAYELFLRGRHEWQTLEPHRMHEALRHLHRAAETDPKLAQVSIEIVRACIARELFGFVEPAEAAQEIRKTAESLLEIPYAAEVLAPTMAWIALHVDRDLPAALEIMRRQNALPSDSWGLRLCALFAAGRHRFAEARAILERALDEDPCSPWMAAALAWILHLDGQADQSIRQIHRCLEIAPDHAASRLYGGIILAFHGETGRAVELTSELTRQATHFDMAVAVHAYALARNGNRTQAEECLERLQWLSRERYVIRSFSAAAYLALDDADSALAELDAANQNRCPWFFMTLADPRLRQLHHRPEFRQMSALVKQMGAGTAEQDLLEESLVS